jgi:HSP20 family protein
MVLFNRPWGWDPWRDLEAFSRTLDRWSGERRSSYPPVNVYESPEAYALEVEVPGVRPEDLEFTVHGDVVTISSAGREQEDATGSHRRERARGSFSRSLQLPVALDSEKIEANYHDGILSVKLPKAAEARPRKITVKAG